MPRRHFLVKGYVQGIGYRWFVQRTASRVGVSGWVRNLANGDVETQAQGNEESLQQFLHELRTGSHWARVDDVQVKELPEESGGTGFDIKGW